MLRLIIRTWRWLLIAAVLVTLLLSAAIAYDSVRPPLSTLMIGRALAGKPVERVWTPLSEISPHLTSAVLMSEDSLFCTHNGVDWDALHEVMNNPDGPSRGASTIPMQVAKNLFLWPGRSYIRKALEIPLALLINAIWSKERILETYFNIAEWGDGIFGAEAASRAYFKKPAAKLSPREAALLATALPNPLLRNPQKPTRLQRTLTATVVARAAGAGPWVTCLH